MRKTRGQASLEFLMTYGWAILVMGVVLVVLWQWGIFTPQGTSKATYMGFWGVMPVDFVYRSDGVLNISFQNNIIDGDINVTEISFTADGIPVSGIPINQWLAPGEMFSWEQQVSVPVTAGNAYTLILSVAYWDNRTGSDTIFTSSGTLQGTVES